jgi:hypothetical protein
MERESPSLMPGRSSARLVQLFERELRDFSAAASHAPEPKKPARRVSQELDQQVVEFASEVRTKGSTPEQMLVELKSMLATVAPEVPGSQRNALLARLTGRAINAFFEERPTG